MGTANQRAVPLTFGSLFTGVGGMDLGLERAGMVCKWQVEINEYCQRVLARRWPNVKRYGDITQLDGSELEPVDLIAGGFPCQDISFAGFGAGLDGERSGLWYEFARIIRLVGPDFVLVENVAALLVRGMGDVLGTLADLGFDAEWSTFTACSVGATHMRRRLFIVAHSNRLNGRKGFRDSHARAFRPLQEVDSFASSRACAKARLANPSELYGGAYELATGLDRNRGIGNAVHPDVAEWIGQRISLCSTTFKSGEGSR